MIPSICGYRQAVVRPPIRLKASNEMRLIPSFKQFHNPTHIPNCIPLLAFRFKSTFAKPLKPIPVLPKNWQVHKKSEGQSKPESATLQERFQRFEAIGDVFKHIGWSELATPNYKEAIKVLKKLKHPQKHLALSTPSIKGLLNSDPSKLSATQIKAVLKALRLAHKETSNLEWDISISLRHAIDKKTTNYEHWFKLKQLIETPI